MTVTVAELESLSPVHVKFHVCLLATPCPGVTAQETELQSGAAFT